MLFARVSLFAAALFFVSHGVAVAQKFPTFINGVFSFGNTGGSSPYNFADTFLLESNPTASKTIYLDFNGHHSVNNLWGHNIVFDAFDRDGNPGSFSTAELIEIQKQFQNIAEDFLPFNVNVTTRDFGPDRLIRSNTADSFYGIRSLATQYKNGFGNGTGGIAYLNSFGRSDDTPVFSFNKGENNGAMTNSHEVGHGLGLNHDGLNGSTYHPGVGGTGPTSWGPIMGAPFNTNLTQWSNGDYAGSTQTEDDYSIITKTANGFGFRVDDHGNTLALASSLAVSTSMFNWGIVEQRTDVDYFSLDLTKGDLSLLIKPFQGRPNLDVLARFYDSNGVLLASSNPFDDISALFNLQIANAGRYFLSIDGTGKAGVYSDYGSLGFYSIEGSFFSAVPEPTSAALLFGLATALVFQRRRKLPNSAN